MFSSFSLLEIFEATCEIVETGIVRAATVGRWRWYRSVVGARNLREGIVERCFDIPIESEADVRRIRGWRRCWHRRTEVDVWVLRLRLKRTALYGLHPFR